MLFDNTVYNSRRTGKSHSKLGGNSGHYPQ
jgi:hypothetical protein